MSTETTRTLKDYRPQHDDNCAINVCVTCREHEAARVHGRNIISGNHEFISTGDCTCGLRALLSSPAVLSQTRTEEEPMRATDQPQLRALGADPRGDDRADQRHERCADCGHYRKSHRPTCKVDGGGDEAVVRLCGCPQFVSRLAPVLTETLPRPICAHPENCCRELSRVWAALGVTTYNGKSASENVMALRGRLNATKQ